jgi:hypothetical protein
MVIPAMSRPHDTYIYCRLLNLPYQHHIYWFNLATYQHSWKIVILLVCLCRAQQAMPLGCHILQSSSIFLPLNGHATRLHVGILVPTFYRCPLNPIPYHHPVWIFLIEYLSWWQHILKSRRGIGPHQSRIWTNTYVPSMAITVQTVLPSTFWSK